MATQVVTSQSGNSSGGVVVTNDTDNDHVHSSTGPGATYANAVLKLKHTDSNKENINDTVHSNIKDHRVNKSVKDNVVHNKDRARIQIQNPDESNLPNSSQDDGDNFTTVTSHSRKERKNVDKHKREKNRDAPSKAPVVNGAPAQHRDQNNVPNKDNQSQDKDSESAMEKKVFVEAPLPKVNPWQSRSAAQLVQGQPQPQTQAQNLKNQDKRVLQPQRQEVNLSGALQIITYTSVIIHILMTFSGNNQPSVVRAPKDRRKFNQKVSLLFLMIHISMLNSELRFFTIIM